MRKVLLSEFYKFFKSRKNIIIITSIFIYLIGINIYRLNRYKTYMKDMERIYGSKGQQAEAILGQSTLLYEKNENLTLEEKEKLAKEIEFYKVEKNKLLLIKHSYKEDNPEKYRHVLIAEIDRFNNIIDGIKNGVITEEFVRNQNLTMEEINKRMKLNQYILDNKIQPIINPYTMTGANSLVMFLEGSNLIIFIFLIALLAVDIYLAEVEEGSYKLSFTQPYGRKELFLGKVITISIVSLSLIILSVLLNFIIVSVICGIGDMNYPFITTENIMKMSLNTSQQEFIILPLWKYVLMGFGLFLLILIFTISLIITISVFLDSSTKTLGFSIILLVLAFIFDSFVSKKSIVNLIYPYCYLYTRNVIEANNRSNYLFGVLLNSLLSVALFIVSYYRFISKDFLGAKE